MLKTPSNGRELLVKLVDVSLSGAAVKCDVKPPIGTIVTLGRTRARVVRHFDGGVATEFTRPMAPEIFDENVRL